MHDSIINPNLEAKVSPNSLPTVGLGRGRGSSRGDASVSLSESLSCFLVRLISAKLPFLFGLLPSGIDDLLCGDFSDMLRFNTLSSSGNSSSLLSLFASGDAEAHLLIFCCPLKSARLAVGSFGD